MSSESSVQDQEMKMGSEPKQQESEHSKQEPRVSDAAPPSITFSHSPPSLRGRKPPPLPVDSLPDSPFSDNHCSPTSSHGLSPIQDKLYSPPPQNLPENPLPENHLPPHVVANRSVQMEPKVVTKIKPSAQDGFIGVADVEELRTRTGTGGSFNRQLRPNISSLLKSRRENKLNRALLGFRISAFVFCLMSFSVMAANKKKGWALDSFDSYTEFRYCLAVNVIGFVYSLLQLIDLANYLSTGKHIAQHQLRGYFDFSTDQILTYLLMSASSSAATRAYDWESNWGKDIFPDMANGSVGLSFLAFGAFALCSLITGYTLCKSTYS
ncbi:CASP-like protein [Quillaja saponaria]|uniref:CASP-like protein n=1 Tax=Quillaja saponaria TaxID=32244 RepID=A0AAD7PX90_QUISA|nr:CASP-like protein [Quillaja saponaria]